MHLGDLGGTPVPESDLTFTWFGSQVRGHPDVSDLLLVDFMADFGEVDAETPEAMAGMRRFLQGVIHPEDWDGFWKAAIRNRQGVDVLMEVAVRLIQEATGGRPTQQPAVSSGGHTTTEQNSGGASSLEDISHRVQERLETEGRADLALVVQQRREHQAEQNQTQRALAAG